MKNGKISSGYRANGKKVSGSVGQCNDGRLRFVSHET